MSITIFDEEIISGINKIILFKEKVETMPGGKHYFLGWVRKNKGSDLHFFLNKCFDLPEADFEDKDNDFTILSTKIDVDNSLKLIRDYSLLFKNKLQDEISQKENLRKECLDIYTNITQLATYKEFYNWLKKSKLKSNGLSHKITLQLINIESTIYKETILVDYIKKASKFIGLGNFYLNKKKKSGIYTFSIDNIPIDLITSFHQYILFFTEYVEYSKNETVNVSIERSVNSLVILIKTKKVKELSKIRGYFNEFIALAREVILEKRPVEEVLKPLKNLENQSLILKMQLEIDNLKNRLKISEFQNKYLIEDREYFRNLTFQMTQKNTVINNEIQLGAIHNSSETTEINKSIEIRTQNNHDGDVQNADSIV